MFIQADFSVVCSKINVQGRQFLRNERCESIPGNEESIPGKVGSEKGKGDKLGENKQVL